MKKTTTTYPARIDGLRYEIVTYELWVDCFSDLRKSMKKKEKNERNNNAL